MAEEVKEKDIISILEERIKDAQRIGDVKTEEAINERLKFLRNFSDPEDIKRLTKKSDEFRSFVRGVTKYSDQEKDAENALNGAMPTRVERDEKTAKKTIDEKGLLSIVPNNGSVEEIYDPESDYSWYKWTPTQGKSYAKAAGMAYGDFLKKVAEMDTQNQRKRIANDGALGSVLGIVSPRQMKDIERDGNVSPASVALDLAENFAQMLPVGRVVGALPKIGKMYRAAKGTGVSAAKLLAENGIVPTTFAMADAARNDTGFSQGLNNAASGTMTNIVTPRFVRRIASQTGNKTLSGAVNKFISSDNPISNYAVNKMGKEKYGRSGLNNLYALDPTGIIENVVSNKENIDEETAKNKLNSEQQKALDNQHTKNIVDEYNATFGVK